MINDIAIILPSKILNNISSPYICNISSRDYENINNGKISYKYLVFLELIGKISWLIN